MTAIFVVVGVVYSPGLLVLALVFAPVTYLLYRHATGRLLGRIYRGVEQQAARNGADPGRGGFGAGPREEWTPPRDGQRRARRSQGGRRGQRRRRDGRARGSPRQPASDGPTPREACEVLGVDPGADKGAVKEAYRERIKEVHPDTAGGDEEAFKRVRAAYEILTE